MKEMEDAPCRIIKYLDENNNIKELKIPIGCYCQKRAEESWWGSILGLVSVLFFLASVLGLIISFCYGMVYAMSHAYHHGAK